MRCAAEGGGGYEVAEPFAGVRYGLRIYMYIYIYIYIFKIDRYIYIYIHMAISHLFLYMKHTPVVPSMHMCSLLHVLCAGFRLCCVREKDCVMYGLFVCVMCVL